MIAKPSPLVVESLPIEFLTDLGIYLQTCAHIEVAACNFVCMMEGVRSGSEEYNSRFGQLRKTSTKDLLPVLRRSGSRLPRPLDSEFSVFLDWIDKYKVNRHIASHGAFVKIEGSQQIRVLYTHQSKKNGRVEYTAEESEITRETALELIEDADRILRILFGLSRSIEKGELNLRP